jgi:hypothetical protein
LLLLVSLVCIIGFIPRFLAKKAPSGLLLGLFKTASKAFKVTAFWRYFHPMNQ